VYENLTDSEIAAKVCALLNKNIITKRRWIYVDTKKME